jgi:5-methylcytosine-specific restriction endonuclease McrA
MNAKAPDNCYGAAQLPPTPQDLRIRFLALIKEASDRIAEQRLKPKQPRTRLDRNAIWEKTQGRCHICGDEIARDSYWEADHVFPLSSGGPSDSANYLPAHGLCNTVKWDRSGEDLQWILKVGVWARRQMVGNSEPLLCQRKINE